MAYHPQTNGSSKQTNQMVKITLYFSIHAIDNPFCQPKILPRIQSQLNNISSLTIRETLNEIAFRFFSRKPLDLCLAVILPDTYIVHTEASNMIFFAFVNQKKYYDRSHQPLFIRVRDWAILKLYKSHSISSSIIVTKKLIQQYIGPFQIVVKVSQLAYKLDVPSDQRIHPIFSIAQFKRAPDSTEEQFQHLCLQHPPSVFLEDDTNRYKSFEIDYLLKKGRRLTVKYFVRQTGYGPK